MSKFTTMELMQDQIWQSGVEVVNLRSEVAEFTYALIKCVRG